MRECPKDTHITVNVLSLWHWLVKPQIPSSFVITLHKKRYFRDGGCLLCGVTGVK